MYKNENLARARAKRDDEYYTLLVDVAKELSHYGGAFSGQSVYCNCDRPGQSAFWTYFHQNFDVLNLKRLTATFFDPDGAFCMVYKGGNDADIGAGTRIPLTGDGSFDSIECLLLLDAADIIVSNPPFSLSRQYITLLLGHGKKFLIVGDLSQAGYAALFPAIKDGKMWFGRNNIKTFLRPDGTTTKFGNKIWYTNIGTPYFRPLNLTRHYLESAYPHYENFDGIDVARVQDIPVDYCGNMGVPETYLLYHNPKRFEIIGCSGYFGKYGADEIGIQEIGTKWMHTYFQQGGTGHYTEHMRVLVFYDKTGRAHVPFRRIVIRKRT